MHSLCHAHTAEYSGTNPPAFNATEINCKYNYRVIQLLYEWDQGKCGRGSWERIDIKKLGGVRMAEGTEEKQSWKWMRGTWREE